MLVRSIAVSALVIGALALNGGLAAHAGEASSTVASVAAAEPAAVPLITMDTYSASDYRVQAAALEPELIEALDEGPGITGTEYLAQADAAANAAATVESLEDYGVAVLGSSLDGTELTINVKTPAAAKLVTELGATPVIGAPATVTIDESALTLIDSAYGGEAIIYDAPTATSPTSQSRCSIGFNGYSIATGAPQLATAGHCIKFSSRPSPGLSGNYYTAKQAAPVYPGSPNYTSYRAVGKPVAGANKLGSGYDAGLVAYDFAGSGWIAKPPAYVINAWTEPQGITPVIDQITATVGATACHSGSTTGWTCGTITAVNKMVNVGGVSGGINSIVMTGCMLGGDSGGPGLIGNRAIGIASWSGFGTSCVQDGSKISGFFPLDSTSSSAASVKKLLGTKWEPAISVNTPTVSAPVAAGSVPYNSTISGTLTNGNVRHSVAVTIDSSTTPLIAKVAANGTWSVKLSGVLPGAHTASVTGTWGTWSKSSIATRAFTVTAPSLYATRTSATAPKESVTASQLAFPSTTPTVYLSTGGDALETLSTIFAAQDDVAPTLYIKRDSLPGVVASELRRLAPAKIIVGGDSGVVSDAVLRELRDYAPSVTRLTEAQLDSTVTAAPATIAAPVQGPASTVATEPAPAPATGAPAGELIAATSTGQFALTNGWHGRYAWAIAP
jgi:hypothetical protein